MAAVTRRGRRTGPTLIKKKAVFLKGNQTQTFGFALGCLISELYRTRSWPSLRSHAQSVCQLLGSAATFKASNAITEIFSRAQTMQSIVLWVVSVKVLVWWRTWEGIVQVTFNYAILGSNSSLRLSNANVAHLIRSLLTQCKEISKSYLSLIFRIIQPFIVAEI